MATPLVPPWIDFTLQKDLEGPTLAGMTDNATSPTILVTGANGFIGRRAVDRLARDGWQVRAMLLPGEPIRVARGPRVSVIRGDVTDAGSVAVAVDGCDAVLHLAALVAEAAGNYPAHWSVTAEGSANVFTAALAVDARVVVTTSICAYGDAIRSGSCPESIERGRPQGPYGVAKQGQEDAAAAAIDEGLRATIIRPSNVYGPGSRPWVELMADMVRGGRFPLFDGGHGDAGLVHVDNLVDAMLAVLDTDETTGRSYNVSDGFGITWARYANDLATGLGAPSPPSVEAAPLLAAALANEDPSRQQAGLDPNVPPLEFVNLIAADSDFPTDALRADTGWSPATSYEDGLAGVIASLTDTTVPTLEIDRTDVASTRWRQQPRVDLGADQVEFELEEFALTSNNISYVMAGDLLDYWGFFPADAPYGRVPVMGHGRIVRSTHPDVEVGGRYFGFFPPTSHHVIDAKPSASGVRDLGEHRAGHAPVYRSFDRVADEQDPDRDRRSLLVRGLFITSWLVDDFLTDKGFAGHQVVITSASSKTSLALAFALRRSGNGPSVGLTSASNLAFVESTGLYDAVVTYDDLDALDRDAPSVIVDMAGNQALLAELHTALADLRHSCRVGATHWEDGAPAEIPGPPPEFFFAPSQLQQRSEQWGAAEVNRRLDEALAAFIDETTGWMGVEASAGRDAVAALYSELLAGNISPTTGQIGTLVEL